MRGVDSTIRFLFLYQDVLELDLPWLEGIVRAKRPTRLPVVRIRDEVRAVLQRGRPDVRCVSHPSFAAG